MLTNWWIDQNTSISYELDGSTIIQVSDLAPNKRSQQTMMRAIWYKWLLDFLSTHVTLFKSTNVKPTSTKRAHEWGKRMIRGEWKMFFQIYLYFFFFADLLVFRAKCLSILMQSATRWLRVITSASNFPSPANDPVGRCRNSHEFPLCELVFPVSKLFPDVSPNLPAIPPFPSLSCYGIYSG